MMRAKNISSLLNNQTSPSDGATVVLSLRGQGKGSHTQQMITLDIERTLRGPSMDRLNSETRIKTSIQDQDQEVEGGEDGWKEVSDEDLRVLLLDWGINVRSISRIVVTQNRHAIDASDPLSLLSHLELLLGTSDLVEMIKEKEDMIRGLICEIEQYEDEREGSEKRRIELEPMIQRCRELTRMERELRRRVKRLRLEKIKIFTSLSRRQEAREKQIQSEINEVSLLATTSSANITSTTHEKDSISLRRSKVDCLLSKTKKDLTLATREIKLVDSLIHSLEEEKAGDLALHQLLKMRYEQAKGKVGGLSGSESKLSHHRAVLTDSIQAAGKDKQHKRDSLGGEERKRLRLNILEVTKRLQRTNDISREAQIKLKKLYEIKEKVSCDFEAASQVLRDEEGKVRNKAQGLHGVEDEEAEVNKSLEGAKIDLVNKRRKIESLKIEIDELSLSRGDDEEDKEEGERKGEREGKDGRPITPLDTFIQTLLSNPAADSDSSSSFLGRLRNIFCPSSPSHAPCINSVLSEILRLSSTLVVRDRGTAHSTLEALKVAVGGFVGSVTCLVLDEVRGGGKGGGGGGRGRERSTLTLPGGVEGVKISHLIKRIDEAADGGGGGGGRGGGDELSTLLYRLIDSLVGSWVMVEDHEGAIRVVNEIKRKAQGQGQGGGRGRGWDLVTEKGSEVFKSDGEIVLQPHRGHHKGIVEYGLEVAPELTGSQALGVAPALHTSALHTSVHNSTRPPAPSSATGPTSSRRSEIERVRKGIDARLSAMDREMEDLTRIVWECEQEISMLTFESQRIQNEALRSASSLSGARRKVDAIVRDLDRVQVQIREEEEKRGVMGRKVEGLIEEKEKLEESLGDDSGHEALDKVEGELLRVKEELRQAQAQLSFHSSKIEAHDKAGAKKQAAQESKRLSFEERRADAKKDEAACKKETRELAASLSELEEKERVLSLKQLKSKALLKELINKGYRMKADLEEVVSERERIDGELKKVIEEIEGEDQGVDQMEGADGAEGAVVAHRNKRQKRRTGRARIMEDSSEEEEGEIDLAWIKEEDLSLRSLSIRTTQLSSTVDRGAIKEDEDLATKIDDSIKAQSSSETKIKATEKEKAAMEEERFQKVISSLSVINMELSKIFKVLSGGLGDSNLSYNTDRSLLFTTGIHLNVRPDEVTRWQPLHRLSGGQASLATLALALAAQSTIPSPFYFFDEIDASLDTINASRVASFLESVQSEAIQTQFIVVSHRPQVYERAGCLVGVWGYVHGSSLIATYDCISRTKLAILRD